MRQNFYKEDVNLGVCVCGIKFLLISYPILSYLILSYFTFMI